MNRKEYQHNWYLAHKDEHIARSRRRKQEIWKWFKELKLSLKCSVCGEDHIACLTFHHDDPKEKERDIAYMVYQGWSKRKILEEIEKCTVMCENCHRKYHWEEKQRALV
ncbi:MAG: hypothetical protein WDA59_05540 [Methanofastidiosum sp.]